MCSNDVNTSEQYTVEMNYVKLLIYWQHSLCMVGFKVCESCIIFSIWENVNSVWYLNVGMLYIYMLYILLERRH